MLSGVKFISRDKIEQSKRDDSDDSRKRKDKRNNKKEERRSRYASSDDDEELERTKKRSQKKKKKWYDDDDVSSSSGDEEEVGRDGGREPQLRNGNDVVRKEMGLDWMLRPKDDKAKEMESVFDQKPEEDVNPGTKKSNPRELNPYLKDNGSGYPEETEGTKAGRDNLLSHSVIGDGGASWRLKALKRAKEQAAREGRKLDDVVEERWDSLGQLAVSVASSTAAHSHAHLNAIKNRKRGPMDDKQPGVDSWSERSNEKNSSSRHPSMRIPKTQDSLSWGKRKSHSMSSEDAGLISSTLNSLNKFSNDGSFMSEIARQSADSGTKHERKLESEPLESQKRGEIVAVKPGMSANQIAAKVMQLRMKGKHEEADNLLKEAEEIKAQTSAQVVAGRPEEGHSRRYMHESTVRQKKKEEDADMHLAHKIMENKKYSVSGQADDEYDYDEGPKKKGGKKRGSDHKSGEKTHFAKSFITQQERCQFCFENPTRPKHLVVAIANFTYLKLPHQQPLVPGHCDILPMQHEASTRNVDNNVWDEIRNFKKCLIMMFAKQEKEVVFIETVMSLAQQRRHCLVECIPLPRNVAKQAPLYFKKAIDEAESEWSQHNSKKLIDTSVKGLRGSIPKDFPYFHVEFGLSKGFVHVIDDETQFKSNFGLNVLRGMLKLPAEDMHRRQKLQSMESQKQAVRSFIQDWEPFDWTKQLDH